jgi:hypothetical protein
VKSAGYFVKFDKIWLFIGFNGAAQRSVYLRKKDSLRELPLSRMASKMPPVAAGTRLSFSGFCGAAVISWFRKVDELGSIARKGELTQFLSIIFGGTAFIVPNRSRGFKTRFPGLKSPGKARTLAVRPVEMCGLCELCEVSPGV